MAASAEISLENTLQAINYLLKPQAYEKRLFGQFDQYLQQVEKSPLIWGIAHQILIGTYPQDVKFFAAKFLKNKLLYDFEEVTENNFQYLLQNISLYLKELHRDDSTLQLRESKSQLLLSFVYFYMHTFEQCGDLLYFLDQSGLASNQALVAEVLQYVAEESSQERLVIEQSKRDKYQAYLVSIRPAIFASLPQLAAQASALQLKYKIIRTFDSWLELDQTEYSDNTLLANPVVEMGFSHLGEVELFEVCGSLVCNVVRLSSFSQAGPLGDFMHTCFAKCIDMLDEEFIDEVDNYINIFTVYGEYLLKECVGTNAGVARQAYLLVFQHMLNVLQHPNHQEIFKTVDYFVYFIRYIKKQDDKQSLLQHFSQPLLSLIYACLKKTTYDSDSFQFDKEDKDQECYDQLLEQYDVKQFQRKDIRVLVEKLVRLIGLKDFLMVLNESFSQIIQLDNEQIVYQHRQLESLLTVLTFALSRVESGHEGGDKLLEMIMVLLNRNLGQPRLEYVTAKLLAKSARLVAGVQGVEQCLNGMLKYLSYLLNGLHKDISIMAISELCRYNKYFVQNNLADFMDLYEKLNHDEKVVQGLVVSLYSLFREKQLSFQDYQQHLLKICQPFASSLLSTLQSIPPDQELSHQHQKSILKSLDRFSFVIIDINREEERLAAKEKESIQTQDEHPFVAIFKTFWPIIKDLLKKFNSNHAIVEKTVRFCKHSMRYMSSHFTEFLPELLEIMVLNYNANPLSSYLYLMEVCFSVFDVHALQPKTTIDNSNVLVHSFNRLVERTFQEFQGLEALDAQPTLCEDFFGMLFRCAKYAPQILNHCQCLDVVLKIGTLAVGIQHIEANKALFLFWEQVLCIVNSPVGTNVLNALMTSHGSVLVYNLFSEIQNVPGNVVMEYILDVLLQLVAVFLHTQYHSQVVAWFSHSLQNLPHNILVQNEKQLLLQSLSEPTPGNQIKYLDLLYRRSKQAKMRQVV